MRVPRDLEPLIESLCEEFRKNYPNTEQLMGKVKKSIESTDNTEMSQLEYLRRGLYCDLEQLVQRLDSKGYKQNSANRLINDVKEIFTRFKRELNQ